MTHVGRLPVRVELAPLSELDLYRIMMEPVNNLLRQHVALLATEGALSCKWVGAFRLISFVQA
jgi:ATP-dependent protease HslVU (ClpYQ) ATPase subunit